MPAQDPTPPNPFSEKNTQASICGHIIKYQDDFLELIVFDDTWSIPRTNQLTDLLHPGCISGAECALRNKEISKFSFPARPGSKTLLVCLGSPAVLRTALRHSTFILSASVVPSCQAWQPYQAVQYVWSKLNFTSLCIVEKTEFNQFTAAIKSPRFFPISISSLRS